MALLLLGPGGATARADDLIEIEIPARNGEIPQQWVSGYTGPLRARVRLPTGYDPSKAYPLIVLLHGAGGNYKSSSGDKLAADAIVVMPEGGTGWHVDWFNGGLRGAPAWESYFLDQVVPQVIERYRIRSERRYHVLMGVSMGGLGTAYLGGRLPGFFGSVAIISGLVDGHVYPDESRAKTAISYAYAGLAPDDPDAIEGPPDGFYSYGHDPVRLAANLRQTRIYMASGDGTSTSPGSVQPLFGYNTAAEGAIIRPASDNYAAALRTAGVAFRYDRHGGAHDGENFNREIADATAWGLFKPVEEHATHWVNDTVATHGKLWEFSYRFDAPPDRIVRFERAGSRLSVGAAGSPVTVTADDGCVFRAATPAVIDIPKRACVRLALNVRPRHLPSGKRTRLRVAVTPIVRGTVIRAGSRRARADAAGVAYLRLCARGRRGKRLTATAPGFKPARVRVPGHARSACRTRR